MKKINKKFGYILDSSGVPSWSVKNDEAITSDGTPYSNPAFSFDSKPGGAFLFPWQYPFLFEEGHFINWRKDGKLPDIDLDIIFFSVEKGFSEFKIEELRKKYPNAKIAGYVKETWLPHQKFFSFDNSRYLGRIEHLKQCDAVVFHELDLGPFRHLQDEVGIEFSCVRHPIDVDYVYENFYKSERELSLFSYLPHMVTRRNNTDEFAKYISEKYNIKYVTRDVDAWCNNPPAFKLKDFVNKWSKCLFHFNLDPDYTMPGSQALQCAALGVINIGGLNGSHRLFFPETATNDVGILEHRIKQYISNPEKLNQVMDYAFKTLKKYNSSESVQNQINNIKWIR